MTHHPSPRSAGHSPGRPLARLAASRCFAATAVLLAGMVGDALAAPGTIVKASGVHAKPFLDAQLVTRVDARAEVEILGSAGAWTQIRTRDGKTGWVRLLSVRPKAAPGGGSLKGILAAGNVARTGATGSTATTGAKGISKEDLSRAQPDFDEVQRLESYRASADEARQYATGARLRTQQLDPLPGQ